MTHSCAVRPSWTIRLLAAALLLGGLRDPRLAALGEAAVFALVWLERPPLGPAGPWLPWLGWAFLSALLSPQPLAALPFLARWSAVLAFASVAAVWGKRERENWLKTVLAATVVLAAAALWTGAPLGFRAGMTGLIPPYYNYTTFAVAAGAAAGAVWALHPATTRPGLRLAGLGVAVLGAACLVLAHARGATLGLIFAAIVWAARRWGAKAGLAALFAAGLAAGAFQARLVPDSWRAAVLRHGGRYKEGRLGIWRRATEMADGKKWLGEGPGNFGAAFRLHPVEAFGGAARWGLDTDYAHSEALQAAAETGWAGLALWLIGLGASLCVLLGRARDEPAREAAAIALAAMAVHLAVDNMLQLPGLAFLFFSAAAVAGAGSCVGPRWPRAVVAAGALLALGAWIPRALADGDPARAAALFPRQSHAREDLAYRAMAAGRLAESDAHWAQAERLAPYDAVYPWRRAQIAAAQGRWDAVESLSARAAVLEPGFLNDRVLRAEALDRLGRSAQAREELGAVLRASSERGEVPASPGYEKAVWDFDRGEYDRVSVLVGR
ncbi:MAG: O-antigen ligase family protein [Elusimicrobiota bacterium]